jgi:hypothetical protein
MIFSQAPMEMRMHASMRAFPTSTNACGGK